MANTYDIGSLVKLSAAITVGGVATDPNTISLTVVDPLGTSTTYTPTKDSTGNYHYNLDLTNATAGTWWYRFSGTGAAQGAEWASFYVEAAQS